jgi:hypothetical protein
MDLRMTRIVTAGIGRFQFRASRPVDVTRIMLVQANRTDPDKPDDPPASVLLRVAVPRRWQDHEIERAFDAVPEVTLSPNELRREIRDAQ